MVLNALRHHGEANERQKHKEDEILGCSTPCGITARRTAGLAGAPELVLDVLNFASP